MLSEKKYTLVIALLPENSTEDIAVVTKLGTISELESKLDIADSIKELLACHKRTEPGSYSYMSLPDPRGEQRLRPDYNSWWMKVRLDYPVGSEPNLVESLKPVPRKVTPPPPEYQSGSIDLPKPVNSSWWRGDWPSSNTPPVEQPMRPDDVLAWPTDLSPELEAVLQDFLPVKIVVDETVPTGFVKLVDATGNTSLFNIAELVAADQEALVRKTQMFVRTNMATKTSEFQKTYEDAAQHIAQQQELEKARAAAEQEADAKAQAQLAQLELDRQAEDKLRNSAIDILNLKRGTDDFGQAIPKFRGI